MPKGTDGLLGKQTGELACSLSADLYADGDTGVFPFAHDAEAAPPFTAAWLAAQAVIPMV